MNAAPARRRQGGYVLLAILAAVFAISAYLLVTGFSAASLRLAQERRTDEALAQAKAALIGYAITYHDSHAGEVPGYLPCPDANGGNGEGSSALNCAAKHVSVVGRMPWRTLGLAPLRDGSGECLWYAVSGTYKNNPKGDLMNWDSQGQFEVLAADGTTKLAGATPSSRAVAVIYAPGRAVGAQGRAPAANTDTCGGNYTASNYLDSTHGIDNAAVSGTAGAVSKAIAGNPGADFNDRLIYITADEIWNAARKRSDFMTQLRELTRMSAECVAAYGRSNPIRLGIFEVRQLPFAAPVYFADGDYGKASNYDDGVGRYAGRLPYRVDTSALLTGSPNGTLFQACAGWAAVNPWWEAWKDQLFYSVGFDFNPSRGFPWGGQGCLADCLRVGSTFYAAVVFLSGPKLAGQARDPGAFPTLTEKQIVGNYLEGLNASTYPNPAGNAQYDNLTPSATFNDILYCVDGALLVNPCP